MKAFALVLLVSVTAGFASDDSEALKKAARKGEFPATFSSNESALEYVRELFAGGRVDRVAIGSADFMVVFRHGSGFPVIGIAVYRREAPHWNLISTQLPPGSPSEAEFFTAESSNEKIIVRGKSSGKTWILYDPNAKKG